jgi:hypothetical protein
MCGLQHVRELHRELSRAGALGEIAWQLRLAAQEKWERGYALGRTGLEAQLKKDDGGLNWGWDELEERRGEKGRCAPAESVSVLVIDLPVGQVALKDDYYAGRRLPPYRGRIDGYELTDLRIAAFVELLLQHRTLDEVRQAVARLAVPDQEAPVTPSTAAPESFDEVLDAELKKPRAAAKPAVTATGQTRLCPKCGQEAAVYLRDGKRTLYCRSCATRRRAGER